MNFRRFFVIWRSLTTAHWHEERRRCRDWLLRFMQADQPKFLTKDKLRQAAMRELNVSKLSFDRGVDMVILIEDTGCHDWYALTDSRRARSQGSWRMLAETNHGGLGSTPFRRGLPDCTVASVRRCREINAINIRSIAGTNRHPSMTFTVLV
jgi:hypothetical protein